MYKIWQINYRTGRKLLRTLPPLTAISLKSIDKEVSCIYFLKLPDSNMICVGVTNIGELSNKIADAQKFFSNDVVCLGIQLCKEMLLLLCGEKYFIALRGKTKNIGIVGCFVTRLKSVRISVNIAQILKSLMKHKKRGIHISPCMSLDYFAVSLMELKMKKL